MKYSQELVKLDSTQQQQQQQQQSAPGMTKVAVCAFSQQPQSFMLY